MREVDRLSVHEYGLGILQMMENAGRNLALHVIDMLGEARGEVAILAGSGGNGGGLCCVRHLHNRGFAVQMILSKEPEELIGAAQAQLQVLMAAGLRPLALSQTQTALSSAQIAVDALVGYSLRGAPRGNVAELIHACNEHARRILSLDVPSGLNATTGETPGVVVRPERTLTLALPKTGLHAVAGDLYLADIGIPPEVYRPLGLSFTPPFGDRYSIRLLKKC